MITNKNKDDKISYLFTDEELKQLALFFRMKSEELPQVIKIFAHFTEEYAYNNMTIAEAECFFKDSVN